MNVADQIRKQILDNYYQNIYQKLLFSGGVQGKGNNYFEKQIENFWENPKPINVLEIGGGQW